MLLKKHIGIVVLFILIALQSFFYIGGPSIFSYVVNPVLFVAVSYLLFHYFLMNKKAAFTKEKTSSRQLALVFFIGIGLLLSSYEELRKIFVAFPLPTPNSDVIGQLEALYLRWSDGVFPYSPVTSFGHAPYPVYMPLHWLPFGLSLEIGIDTRWAAILFYILSSIVYMALLIRRNQALWRNLFIAILPAFVLWLHIYFLPDDIAVSPEYLIGGYYLMLGAGLIRKNIFWITVGVICCLLSRYTFIFWLPILFIYAFKSFGVKKTFIALGTVTIAFLLIYVVPFLLKDSSILQTGVAYHNNCAVDELRPRGHDPMGWSFSYGLHFAYYFRTIFLDMPAEQLAFVVRAVQASVMLLICLIGIIMVRSKHYAFGKYSIAFLYAEVLLFFSFSPLSYRYYYFVLLILSVLLLAQRLARTNEDVRESSLI